MRLYLVTHRQSEFYVPANSMAEALAVWQAYTKDPDQPDSITKMKGTYVKDNTSKNKSLNLGACCNLESQPSENLGLRAKQ